MSSKRDSRKDLILYCLEKFNGIYSLGLTPHLCKNIAERIVARYFGGSSSEDSRGITDKLKGFMKNENTRCLLDIHKIIAGTQYSIMMQLLIQKMEGPFVRKFNPMSIAYRRSYSSIVLLNAKFALFVGIYMLCLKYSNLGKDVMPLLSILKKLTKTSFYREYIKLLCLSNPDPAKFPTMAIAYIWFFVDYLASFCKQ